MTDSDARDKTQQSIHKIELKVIKFRGIQFMIQRRKFICTPDLEQNIWIKLVDIKLLSLRKMPHF